MSRLVDPTICPDCRAPLDAGARCTGCGLTLAGPLAAHLWDTMRAADGLVEQLRAAPQAMAATRAPVAEASLLDLTPAGDPLAPLAPLGPPPLPTRPRRLPPMSVPVVLLSLGALCLLVAAIVFVAVTWSVLGLTGRTIVLLGFTALLAAIAVLLTRRTLRIAAETFWLVVAGMLTVDLLAAHSAGLAGLDALSWRGTGAMVGTALLLMGVAVGAWARALPVDRLYGVEVVAVVGAFVVTLTNGWAAENPAVGTSVALVALTAAAFLVRPVLPVVALGLAGLSVASWLVLGLIGGSRAAESASVGDWWSDVRGWPLLAAAAFAAVWVLVPRVGDGLRAVSALLALVPLVVLVNAPLGAGSPTRVVLVAAVTLIALALAVRFAELAWAQGASVLSGLGMLGLGGLLALAPWGSLVGLHGPDAPLGLRLAHDGTGAAVWTNVVVVVAVVAAAACLLRFAPAGERGSLARSAVVLSAAVVGVGLLEIVLELEPSLWLAVLVAATVAAAMGAGTWSVRDRQPANLLGTAATAYLVLLAAVLASQAWLLAALLASALAVALGAAATLRERVGADLPAALLGLLAALAGGVALVEWGLFLEADATARSLVLSAYAGLLGLAAAPATRRAPMRVGVETAAGALALVAVGMAPDGHADAMSLTVVGTAIAAIAVLNRDRSQLGWLGAFVLGLATLIRVDLDVTAPELYTLPAAALLVGAGSWRLRTDRTVGSLAALGSGLTLALVPSLLLTLDDPVSLRGALTAAAAVATLAAGVASRLIAPFVWGAVATATLAVRHLEPYADAVPRWVVLALVGSALLGVGITWESRLRDLRRARGYLTALR